jgi:hypothetical protein
MLLAGQPTIGEEMVSSEEMHPTTETAIAIGIKRNDRSTARSLAK